MPGRFSLAQILAVAPVTIMMRDEGDDTPPLEIPMLQPLGLSHAGVSKKPASKKCSSRKQPAKPGRSKCMRRPATAVRSKPSSKPRGASARKSLRSVVGDHRPMQDMPLRVLRGFEFMASFVKKALVLIASSTGNRAGGFPWKEPWNRSGSFFNIPKLYVVHW